MYVGAALPPLTKSVHVCWSRSATPDKEGQALLNSLKVTIDDSEYKHNIAW